jgi:serine/threonine protein kinase
MNRSGHTPTFVETESLVLKDLAIHFARAWAALPPEDTSLEMERFLPPQGTAMRRPALLALIKVDLAQRWQRGQRPLLDEYLQKYPELGSPLTVAPELILAEFQVRQQHGDQPALAAYRSRFPMQFADLERQVHSPVDATMKSGSVPFDQTGMNVEKTLIRSMPPIPESVPDLPSLSQIKPVNTNFLAAAASANEAKVLQVGGGYKLHKRIGSGSFGEVWRAEAPGGVEVAVKIILRPLDSEEAKRELSSLDIIKRLKHPFLLDTQAFWSLEDRLLIVMELADGSLRDRLKECRKAGLPAVPVAELLNCFRESAEALDFLHSQGVQHRDIKPENILLLQRHAKVADFGLARVLQSLHAKSASMSGTPMYMAPEVWQGLLSPHSDQYSLAFTYGELRLGRSLFRGESLVEVMHHHLTGQPDLSALPAAEQAVLLRALAKNPEERFGSCMEFMQALYAALKEELHREGGTHTAVEFRLHSGTAPAWPSQDKTVPINLTAPQPSGQLTARPAAQATQEASELPPELPPDLPPPPARRKALIVGIGGLLLTAALAVGTVIILNLLPEGEKSTKSGVASTHSFPLQKVFLPPGCIPADKSETVTLSSGQHLYKVIERQLEDGTRIPFRLIYDPSTPLQPFYIMENKVTNALFQKFAQAKPQAVKSKEWLLGGLANEKDIGVQGKEQYPVFRVAVEDAHRFAVWLGGRLPSGQQWDLAAGYTPKWKGPYRGDPFNFDRNKDIAVDRAKEGPLPAGSAVKDISYPFELRDMAGNGCEWTRTISDKNFEVPAAGDTSKLYVELRGRSYLEVPPPLVFSDTQQSELAFYNKCRTDVSFRVVLEIP